MKGLSETDEVAVSAELEAELERLKTCDPFAALGLSPSAGEAEVRAAFLALTKTYHPSRFARRSHEVARLANEVYLRIKSAYGQLAEAAGRQRERSRLGTETGEPVAPIVREPTADDSGAFSAISTSELRARQRAARQRAVRKRAERVGRTEEVATVVPPRPSVEEEERRREEEFTVARRILAGGEFAQARREFHRLAIADPQRKELRVYLHFAWGREHQGGGDTDNALAEYNRALKLDPGFDPARKALDSLHQKAKGRGLFSKLFGK